MLDIAGESIWGFQAGMVTSATVLVMILRHLGAGRTMIASIVSVETCAMLFPQVAGLFVFRSAKSRKIEIIAYHYLAMIPFLFLMAGLLRMSGHFPPAAVRACLLICWGLFTASIGVVSATWWDWIASLFTVRFRGTVMGLAFFGGSGLGMLGGILSGWMIGHGRGAGVYADIYALAGAIALLAMTTFWFIDDRAAAPAHSDAPSLSSISVHFRQSLAQGNFRAFLIGRIIALSGFCILPLVADYFASRDGGAIAPGALVTCGAAMAVGTALGNLGLGRLGDKHGHRIGLIIGIGAQIAALAALILVPGRLCCLPVYFVMGICAGSGFMSHYNMVFETCPHENRMAHITLTGLVIGAFTMLTPILAGAVAGRFGVRIIFEASLLLSLISLAWFITTVKEPRSTSPGIGYAHLSE